MFSNEQHSMPRHRNPNFGTIACGGRCCMYVHTYPYGFYLSSKLIPMGNGGKNRSSIRKVGRMGSNLSLLSSKRPSPSVCQLISPLIESLFFSLPFP